MEYKFTRHTDGSYVVTTPAGEAWRLLDGSISVHARSTVVCVQLFGADSLLPADVMAAWRRWWQNAY
jgi:hypothetical protein